MTQAQLAWYREMEERGELTPMRRPRRRSSGTSRRWGARDGRATAAPIGYVLSLEGADSIVTLAHLERAYGTGLRAVGPAHYGPGTYAQGTDATGGIGDAGRELLREMDRLGMILDVTHLCDDSFWEAVDVSRGRSGRATRTAARWCRTTGSSATSRSARSSTAAR